MKKKPKDIKELSHGSINRMYKWQQKNLDSDSHPCTTHDCSLWFVIAKCFDRHYYSQLMWWFVQVCVIVLWCQNLVLFVRNRMKMDLTNMLYKISCSIRVLFYPCCFGKMWRRRVYCSSYLWETGWTWLLLTSLYKISGIFHQNLFPPSFKNP